MSDFWVYIALLAAISSFIYHYRNDNLSEYPGPFFARWTSLWQVFDTLCTWHKHPSILQLHQTYGEIVRVGPRNLSFANPKALRDLYGPDKHFVKSQMYRAAAATAQGVVRPSLFSSTDDKWHDALRRAVQPAFNLSSLMQYEPFVDKTIQTYISELEGRFCNGSTQDVNDIVDLPRWMRWFAIDVIGEITYGSSFGCLDSASDASGIIRATNRFLSYSQAVGPSPLLDSLLLKNPLLLWLNRHGCLNAEPNPIVPWALKHQVDRISSLQQSERAVQSADRPKDLLDQFIEAKSKNQGTISDREVLSMGISMVLAGSESTAVELTAFFYFLLTHTSVYTALQEELETNIPPEERAAPTSFKRAQKLPYLDACIKETFRLHPAGRFSPERLLPPQGATIIGRHIPGGTTVSANAWVLHRRPEVFGDDVDNYRPERWLSQGGNTSSSQLAEMNRCLFIFGMDKYNCIGKNISTLEIYKLVPSLLLSFHFELADPRKEWRFEKGSFVNISGVDVRVRRRSETM